jgi:ElaB/YqjD/DUF883 family membrane-anchored ribosome-binding protein
MSSSKVEARHSAHDGHAGAATAHPAADAAVADGEAANVAIHDLVAEVQDLLSQLAHVADPDIARLRARLTGTLATAKRSIVQSGQGIRRRTRAVVRGGDAYVRHNPWQAVGIAAVAGAVVGLLAFRRK